MASCFTFMVQSSSCSTMWRPDFSAGGASVLTLFVGMDAVFKDSFTTEQVPQSPDQIGTLRCRLPAPVISDISEPRASKLAASAFRS